MSKRKIVITHNDYRRLEALLASDLAEAIGDKSYLADLQSELEQAMVVESDKVPKNVVTMNSTVRFRDVDTGEVETYTLVFPNEADIAANKLSILAPIGTAILGHRVGNVVRWLVPSGKRRLKVEAVLYQPEREGALHL